MRRKERVKGRTRMEEVMVWEILRLRIVKSGDEGGNPAAWKREVRWLWVVKRRGEEGRRDCERRSAAEKGKARRREVVVKYW